MKLDDFIRRNYLAACQIQRSIVKDNYMKNMVLNDNFDRDLVKSWMQDYGLFQGRTSAERYEIVDKYISVIFDITKDRTPDNQQDITLMLEGLCKALYETNPRKWLSASSKLLWCSFPDEFVIYDSFVERTLVVLQCISPKLHKYPRLGSCPKLKTKQDISQQVEFYINYQNIVNEIYFEHFDLLVDLREQHEESYPHDIRIIDKVLWMIGNPNYQPI